jgi:segregation and condensation protein B
LLDRGLVRITGRSDELGNPFLYGTTRRFLEIFGLPGIQALPRGDRLRGQGLPDWSAPGKVPETSERVAADTAENPDNSGPTGPNALDEPTVNSQNSFDFDPPAKRLQADDPEEE